MEDQITLAIAQMTLGAYDPPVTISAKSQAQALIHGQHTIVVRRLHHTQNAQRLRDLLIDLWKLDDKSDAIIHEDGTILATFSNEVRMMDVFNNEPWHYRGWFLAIDLWSNRFSETYLEEIMLWVKILNIPGDYKHEGAIKELGKRIGVPVKSKLRQNSWGIGTDCLVTRRQGKQIAIAEPSTLPRKRRTRARIARRPTDTLTQSSEKQDTSAKKGKNQECSSSLTCRQVKTKITSDSFEPENVGQVAPLKPPQPE